MDPTNLFDSQFTVTAIDPDGKKFDRVSRIIANSSSLDMNLSLDIAVDIYPINSNQTLTLQLASSLHKDSKTNKSNNSDSMNIDGDGDEEVVGGEINNTEQDSWRFDRQGNAGVADEFDYVMYGKIYKYDEGHSDTVTVYGSFGGLLMALTGSYRHLSGITVGTNVYLLIR